MASWKKVLTEVDKATDAASAVADNETGLVTGNAVFDYIAAQNFATGSGDIEGVTAGDGITGGGVTGTVTVAVEPDDVTIELSASDGSGQVRAKTAAIADAGTALATADQIHTFVTGFGYTTNTGTVTGVTSADTNVVTIGGTAAAPTVDVVTAAIADAGTGLATADQIHTFVTGFGYTTSAGTVTGVDISGDSGSHAEQTSAVSIAFATGDGITSAVTDSGVTHSIDAAQTEITSILNTGLVVGRTAGTQIKFDAANQVTLRAGSTDVIDVVSTAVLPTTSGGPSLGSASKKFQNGFFSNAVSADGNVVAGGNLSVTGTSTLTGNVSAGGNVTVTDAVIVGDGLTVQGGGADVTGNSFFTGNATITGNLTVSGTTTTLDTANLLVEDPFIMLNNASEAVDGDAGIVIEGATKNVAFGYDQSADRFGFLKTGAAGNMTSIAPNAFYAHAHTADGNSSNADSDLAQYGNIYVDSGTQDIYIYS